MTQKTKNESKLLKKNIQDIIALTPMQEGLLFHYLKDEEDNNDYLNQLELTLKGDINIDLFKAAWQHVVNANEMLRAVFLWEGVKIPVQVIKKETLIDFTYVSDSNIDVETIKVNDKKKGFNLSESCFRVQLIKLTDNRFKLLITNHHIIYDGWSNGILIKAVLDAYSELSKGNVLTINSLPVFKQYVKNNAKSLKGAETYWSSYLEDYERSSFIPTSIKKEEILSSKTKAFNLSSDLVKDIESYSKKKEISVASIFFNAWGILLQNYSNTNDVLFGTAISDRPKQIKGIENAIGLYIKTIPFRNLITKDTTVEQAILRANEDLIQHQEKGNGALNDILKVVNKSVGKGEIFETIFTFENYPIDTDIFLNEDIKIEEFSSREKTHYPIEVMVEKDNGYKFIITYNANIFNEVFIESLLKHYENIVKISVTEPTTKVAKIQVMPEREINELLALYNLKKVEYPREKTIHQLFEEQVELYPNKTAISFQNVELTYRELNTKANQLAHILKAEGISNNDIVALCVERSIDVVIGMLAILKSGGAYLPIDVDYPQERKSYLLTNSQAKYIVTSKDTDVAVSENCKIITVDYNVMSTYSSDTIYNQNKPSDLAYIIYTSGTTGLPKGVQISHNNVVRLFKNENFQFSFSSHDVWTLFHSHCFDFSVWEMYGALLFGGRLIVLSKEEAKDTVQFIKILQQEKVSVLNQTPSAFYNLMAVAEQQDDVLNKLKYVIFGGEALAPSKLKKWKVKYPQTKLINMYGITETTVHVTYKEINEEEIENGISTIGKPIPTLDAYIFNKDLKLVPKGIPGELFIAGEGLSKGYLNNEKLTAKHFIKNPYNQDEVLYKTGDWARILPNGDLEYQGRIDSQVKIRGYRIELGEIENQLLTHKAINEAIVRVKQNETNKSLIAYYKTEENINSEQLKKYLLERLPEYMVPSQCIKIDEIPLTSNGKIDDIKLLEIKGIDTKKTIELPKNDTENLLLKIWNDVINTDKISVSDNFFEIGGDSLNMIRLSSAINKAFETKTTITDLFKYTSIKTLAQYIDGEHEEVKAEQEIDTAFKTNIEQEDIAIIGMAGRFPKAKTIEEFWNNLKQGVEGITVEDHEEDKTLIKSKGHLEERTLFDNSFFDYSPKEASMMDPQTRILHECVWEALEDSGYDSYQYNGKIALFAGSTFSPFYGIDTNDITPEDLVDNFDKGTYAERDFLASRVSYKLNLKGAGMTVLTACSSSLVAIDMACSKLHLNQCDIALAGGVSVTFHDDNGYVFNEGMILSPDGHCRAFDKNASGTVGGNGAGVIVLKKLSKAITDNDNILAVIKGTATNNDGNYKVGYTAPSVTGQAEVIKEAIAKAKVSPEDITYIEAHGTGTSLGDPIEIEGLKTAFNNNKKQYCAIGSVKTSIGHLDAAAGVAGVIKTVLSLKNKKLLPSLHFNEANPEMDLENSPFFVNTTFQDWNTENKPRIAGVSSFGIGGTNAHVIIEEAPTFKTPKENLETQLLVISGKSKEALNENTNKLESFLENNPEINTNQLGQLLQTTRKGFVKRRFVVANDLEDLKNKISKKQYKDGKTSNKINNNVAFMFTGQGAQYANMTEDLYLKGGYYTNQVNNCLEIIKTQTGEDFKAVLFNKTETTTINETYYTQALLFTIEYAMAKYLMHLNIKPNCLIGHSIGEYAAACIAGVFSLEEALKIVLKRGALMQKANPGTMLSISKSSESIAEILPDTLDMATINTEESCVVSGSHEAIDAFLNTLKEQDIAFVRLKTSHGFHSSTMDPVLEEFEAYLSTVKYNNPELPFVSNYTGTWITNEQAVSPNYWAKHLRHAVKFSEGIKALSDNNVYTFIEVGPSRTLSNFVKNILPNEDSRIVFNSIRHPKERKNDYNYFLQKIGELWLEGFEINWLNLHENKTYRKIALPTYAFQKNDFPLQLKASKKENKPKGLKDWFYTSVWEQMETHTNETILDNNTNWLVFTNNSPLTTAMVELMKHKGNTVISITKDSKFEVNLEESNININPTEAIHYEKMLDYVLEQKWDTFKVLHAWNIEDEITIPNRSNCDTQLDNSLYSMLYLAKGIGNKYPSSKITINVLTNELHNITGEEEVNPYKGTLLGAIKVIPLEYSNIKCRSIDIKIPTSVHKYDTLIGSLYNDYNTDYSENIIAYRGKRRWVQKIKNTTLKTPNESHNTIKQNGLYLITGGFGGMGVAIANYLATEFEANLVLVTRNPLPERGTWDAIIAEEKDNKLIERIQHIQNLESVGSKVYISAGSLNNFEALQNDIQNVEKELGAISGIFHTAGVIDNGGIIHFRTKETIEQYIESKVQGTLILQDVFKDRTLDFTILFSSVSNVLYKEQYGQVAYNAANDFLEAYADFATLSNNDNVYVINWCAWSDSGMAVKAKQAREVMGHFDGGLDFDENAITSAEGVKAIEYIISNTLRTVSVYPGDLNEQMEKSYFKDFVNTETLEEVNDKKSSRIARPSLESEYITPTTPLQSEIAELWADSFGYETIGIRDNYFDLGGDSLKAVAISSKMNKLTGKNLSLPQFLNNPTIEELSHLMESTVTNEDFTYPVLVHDKENAHKTFPLTPIQLAYLFGRSNNIELGGISTHGYVEIEASLDAEKLSKAIQKVIDRHAILRTVVTNDGNQKLLEGDLQYDLKIDDISNLSEKEKTNKIKAVRKTMSHHVFDIYKWPLFEMKVFQITHDEVYIFFGIDLIISDAGSTDLLASELMQYYRNPKLKLPELEFTFRDYVLGLNAIKESPFYVKDKAYWTDKIKTFPSAPELPIKVAPSAIESPRFNRLEKIFDTLTWKQLKRIASKNNITPSVLLCTAFTEVLAFWGNQQELGLNMTLFNRLPFHEDVPKMMGDFTSLVLLDVQLDRDKTFYENAKVIQKELFEAMDHRHYDGVECITELRRLKNLGDKAVMPVVFTSTLQENEDEELNFWNELGNIKKSISQTPQVFLDHQLMLKEGTLILGWDYVEQLFDEDIIETMFNQYIERIEKLLEDEIPEAVTVPEHHLELLQDYNNSFVTNSNTILQDLFYNDETLNSNAIAVENNDVQWTYKELFNKANQVAAFLKSKNIGRGHFVGVSTDRNEYTISNILGITIAGAAYVPIDNTHPEERKQYILEKSSCKWMLTVDAYTKDNIVSFPTNKHEIVSKADDIAYIIFTSGSTGQPKGVVIKHSAVVNTIVDINQRFNVTNEDRILGISSLTFDLSVYDIYGSFHAGARLVLLDNQRDVELIKNTIVNKGITVWNSVPAIMDMLTKYFDADFVNKTISKVMLSGDWIPIPLPEKIKTHFPNANVISMGGATEASIWSIYYEVDKVEEHWKSIPYGYPLGNQTFYVLNASQEQCPVDVTGELYIGGIGVAEGYINEEELTRNAFIQHKTLGRIYKTGDYGVFRKEGHIEFLGRKDNQVKIRGYRVELGEISTHLRAYEGIKQAIAIDYTTDSGEKNLAAYYVSDQEIDGNTLKNYLSTLLPDYMLPAFISKIEDIPLTPNGKINRKSLAIPKENLLTKNTKKEGPQTATEKLVFSKWQDILNTEQIGIHDDFFLVGGNSIKLIELFKVLEEDYPSIKVNKLFEHRTIHSFSSHLNEQTTETQKPKKAKAKIAF